MISLKQLCLSLIAEEFERFHFAFSTSKNESLKRNFEFLQRIYSSDIASELEERGMLKNKYLDFVLNEHLKILNVTWLGFKYLSNTRHTYSNIFCRLPNLIEVNCFETNDELLENVAKFCPKIIEINGQISYVKKDGNSYLCMNENENLTDNGIRYLCKNENGNVPCPELKRLSVNSCTVTDEGLTRLIQDLPSLEVIPQILYSLHKENLHNLEKLPRYNLIYLDLLGFTCNSYYADLLKISLTLCPRLKSLRCFIYDKKQLDFFNDISLEELSLYISDTTSKININDFLKTNGNKLVYLKVFNCLVSVNVLSVSCPKLQHLKMEDCAVLDDHENSQTVFHCLTNCVFQRFDAINDRTINKAICLFLSSSPNLENLAFNHCDLSQEVEDLVLKCCEKNRLRDIIFWDTSVEVEFLENILWSCSSLQRLRLENCGPFQWEAWDMLEELNDFRNSLPNKPDVYVDGGELSIFERVHMSDADDDY